MDKDELRYSYLKLAVGKGGILVTLDTYYFWLRYEEACWLHFMDYGIMPWDSALGMVEYRFVYIGDDL